MEEKKKKCAAEKACGWHQRQAGTRLGDRLAQSGVAGRKWLHIALNERKPA